MCQIKIQVVFISTVVFTLKRSKLCLANIGYGTLYLDRRYGDQFWVGQWRVPIRMNAVIQRRASPNELIFIQVNVLVTLVFGAHKILSLLLSHLESVLKRDN